MPTLTEKAYDAHRSATARRDDQRATELRRDLASLLASGLKRVAGVEHATCIEVVSFTNHEFHRALLRVDGALIEVWRDNNTYHPGWHASLLSECVHCGALVEIAKYSVSLPDLGKAAARVQCSKCERRDLPNPRPLLGILPAAADGGLLLDAAGLLAALERLNQTDSQLPIGVTHRPQLPHASSALAPPSDATVLLLPGYGQSDDAP